MQVGVDDGRCLTGRLADQSQLAEMWDVASAGDMLRILIPLDLGARGRALLR
jgi:hypothetical protein